MIECKATRRRSFRITAGLLDVLWREAGNRTPSLSVMFIDGNPELRSTLLAPWLGFLWPVLDAEPSADGISGIVVTRETVAGTWTFNTNLGTPHVWRLGTITDWKIWATTFQNTQRRKSR